ncbi:MULTISPECIES: ABC transporter permease [unclassified Meiothermus]|uniref:ABC transporter permease n=1 Tax=unclassified Meiothermus TaxID=370471 RepID=UPI000D7C3AA0|nr:MULTISPECIES: ABC transporter permease [unclassified Meiothermus]PZA07028.1 ABC transporter permease [Meiothermus sp. Pnk-1]RYM34293.1 ABC transporter permease [Meiothermus sp. PNK-Is4]
MNEALRIFRKELLSTLRERRVLFTTLILPIVLMPVLMYGPLLFFGNAARKTAEATQKIGVQNLPEAAIAALRAAKLEPVPTDSPLEDVRGKKFQAAVGYQGSTFTVYGRLSGATQSSLVVDKIQEALRGYKDRLVAQALQERGLSAQILEPVSIRTQDASRPQEQAAGVFAFLIPYFLVIFILNGGQAVAIDATAGEKEKGTLEALLSAPVPLLQIVLGKALAVLTVALAAAFAGVAGIVLGGTLMRSLAPKEMLGGSALGGGLSLEPTGYLALLLTAVLFAAMMVSVQLSLGVYARTFKEAQSYMAPLLLAFIVPLLLLQFSDFLTQQSWFYLVPAFNVMLLLDGLVKGSAEGWQITLTWLSTLLFSGLALMLAVRNFRREEVVFRN